MSKDLHSGNYVSPFDSDPGKPIDAIYTWVNPRLNDHMMT